MPKSPAGESLVFLDACCLINLFGSGRAEVILRALPYRFAVARYVAEKEVLEIGSDEAEPGAASEARGRIALSPVLDGLIDQGVLPSIEVTTQEEQRELIRFAVDLDDGEARTCALALTRHALVATDDKKAIRVLRAAVGQEAGSDDDPCLRTSELLFEWAEREEVPEADLVQVVRSIARNATILPPRSDPHFDRWMKLLETGG